MRKSRSWLARALEWIAAVAIGLALQSLVASHLGAIQRRADSDLLGARAELAFVLQVLAVGLFGSIAALGVWMTVASRRALVLRRFPPPGAWGFGSRRVFEGDAARRVAIVMLALALLLVACSLAGGAISWTMAERLLACRSGVPNP